MTISQAGTMPPDVYLIGCGSGAPSAGQPSAQTMGFKAWNLSRMAQLSLPVPPAFAIGTN
jgi:pyruvate,orthophosphate dikinase